METKRRLWAALLCVAASLAWSAASVLPAAEDQVAAEAESPRESDSKPSDAQDVANQRAADDRYAVAAGHYHDRRWQLAADEFKSFIAAHHSDARVAKAHFFRGEALAQLDQYAAAGQEFAEVLRSEPEGRYARQSLFRSAECALLSKDAAAAAELFGKFRTQYPDDDLSVHVIAYQADLALGAKDYAAAQKQYTAALARAGEGPLASDCQFGLARSLQLQGDLDAAAAQYRKLADSLQGDGQQADGKPAAQADAALADKALYYLGDLQLTAGEHEAAERTLAELVTSYPQSSLAEQAALLRAVALRHLGRFDEADQLLSKIEPTSPRYIEAQYGLGLSQKAQRHYERAAELLLAAAPQPKSQAGTQPPHRLSAAMHFEAGDALLLANKLDEAAAEFDLVLKNWPDGELSDDALLGKLQVALARSDHAQGVTLADEFLERYPDSTLHADVRLTRATLLAKQGDRTDAEAALQKITADQGDAKQPGALATLVVVQTQKQDLAAATKSLAELRRADPSYQRLAPLAYQLAEAAYAAEKFELAAENFQLTSEVAAAKPSEPAAAETNRDLDAEADAALTAGEAQPNDLAAKATSGLGWAQFQQADYTAAAATFGRLLEKFPQHKLASEAALVRGQSLEKLSQWDGALAAYHLLLQSYPEAIEVPPALWRAGRLHQRLEQSREAVALFEQLVDKHKTAAHADAALYHWGWLEFDAGNTARAAELWNRVRQEYPDGRLWADATYRLAERALVQRQYETAAALTAEVLAGKATPDLVAHTLFLQARIAIAEGQWAKVAAPLKQLLAEHAESSLALSAQFWLAEAAYRQGQYEAALAQHTTLIRDGRTHQEKWLPTAALRRGQALAQLGRWPEALEAAQQVEKDFPDFAERYEVDYLVGRCLASQADFDGARAAYQKVLQSAAGGKTETAAMAQWMIGESYFHQEDYPAALREYLPVDILFAYPQWQASALLQAGKCHELAFEWKDASGLYTRLLKNFPESSLAEEAKRRLEIAQERAKTNRRT